MVAVAAFFGGWFVSRDIDRWSEMCSAEVCWGCEGSVFSPSCFGELLDAVSSVASRLLARLMVRVGLIRECSNGIPRFCAEVEGVGGEGGLVFCFFNLSLGT